MQPRFYQRFRRKGICNPSQLNNHQPRISSAIQPFHVVSFALALVLALTIPANSAFSQVAVFSTKHQTRLATGIPVTGGSASDYDNIQPSAAPEIHLVDHHDADFDPFGTVTADLSLDSVIQNTPLTMDVYGQFSCNVVARREHDLDRAGGWLLCEDSVLFAVNTYLAYDIALAPAISGETSTISSVRLSRDTTDIFYVGKDNSAFGASPLSPLTYQSGILIPGVYILTARSFCGRGSPDTILSPGETGSASLDYEFHVKELPVPEVVTTDATEVNQTFAILNGSVNPNYNDMVITFEWAVAGSDHYTETDPVSFDPHQSSPQPVSIKLSSLLPMTAYTYRIAARIGDETLFGEEHTFVTSALPRPIVVTQKESGTSLGGPTPTTLHGTVQTNSRPTTSWFEYWYGTYEKADIQRKSIVETLQTSNAVQSVSATIDGLLAGARYNYRLVAKCDDDNQRDTVFGNTHSFVTGSSKTVFRFSSPNYHATSQNGSARVIIECVGGNFFGASVILATTDGSAKDGVDYYTAGGRQSWEIGDAGPRAFDIDLVRSAKGTKTFSIALSSAEGQFAELGDPSIATITLNDEVDPAPLFSGTFDGAVEGGRGRLLLSVTKAGRVTGTLALDGNNYKISGLIDANDTFYGKISPPIPFTFSLTRSDTQITIVGTAKDATMVAYPAASHGETAGSASGQYTLIYNSAAHGPDNPVGSGFATATLARSGGVVISGMLPDGEPFRINTSLRQGAAHDIIIIHKELPYQQAIQRGAKGFLSGSLILNKESNAPIYGDLRWFKPTQKKGTHPMEINTILSVSGAVFTKPGKATSILPDFTSGKLRLNDLASLNIFDGHSLQKDVTLVNSTKFQVTNPSIDKLNVSIVASNGFLKGSFIYPGTKKHIMVRGAILQTERNGAGMFLGPSGSGALSLVPLSSDR